MKLQLLANTLKQEILRHVPDATIETTVEKGHIHVYIDDLDPYVLDPNFNLSDIEKIGKTLAGAISQWAVANG